MSIKFMPCKHCGGTMYQDEETCKCLSCAREDMQVPDFILKEIAQHKKVIGSRYDPLKEDSVNGN